LLDTGTKAELMGLPGIGATSAEAAIEARPLESATHLVTVSGIGEKTFSGIVK
jgi:DNA uptake protein ComE-like DNA-binding protein